MDAFNFLFKVIIVHEDTVAGMQAVNVLQQLASQLENKLGMDINPWEICSHVWQFNWLEDPQLYEQAVAESIKADMIIISTDGRAELPPRVRGWIESVLPQKKGAAAALVALLGDNHETAAASPSVRYLRQLAAQYGVDFLCNADGQPRRTIPDMKPVLCRFEDEPAFLAEVVPQHTDRRGWGIND